MTQATDAHLLARAILWAGERPACNGETFNVTNGDELVWRSVWPALADAFGMPVGDEQPISLAQAMPEHAAAWRDLAARHGLRYPDLAELVGGSWQFLDAVLGGGRDTLVSTVKIRQFGFHECLDTEAMFTVQWRRLQAEGILPP